jgi:hypothetical protein
MLMSSVDLERTNVSLDNLATHAFFVVDQRHIKWLEFVRFAALSSAFCLLSRQCGTKIDDVTGR